MKDYKTRILVVEDESIVAKDIQNTLIRLGYDVPATASNATSALEKIEQYEPDLVFLDIKLKGDVDGIQIAEHIKNTRNIPVIFLTSFVDKATLDRAKVTEPYGYLVKPFNENDLNSTIEMALYKYGKDKERRESLELYENTLTNIEDSIVIVDNALHITYINQTAEELVGYGNDSIQGIDLSMIIKIENEQNETLDRENFNELLSGKMDMNQAPCTVSILRTQEKLPAKLTTHPIRDEKNQLIGGAFIIRDSRIQKEAATIIEPSTPEIIQGSFFVKKGSTLVKVYLENIQWIQAMDNYVIIQTHVEQFVIHSTMKDIEAKLPSNKFMRVHRSYIVSLEKINVLDESAVVIGDKTIPIGKSYKEAFMNKLNFL